MKISIKVGLKFRAFFVDLYNWTEVWVIDLGNWSAKKVDGDVSGLHYNNIVNRNGVTVGYSIIN